MIGSIALHGGGEFLRGDEPFLRAILEMAPRPGGLVRIAVVPTAAARGRPEFAAANGVAAFRRVAAELGLEVLVNGLPVVDRASAADPAFAETLAASTLIHLPGGDPDIIPTLYPGTAAWDAIERAHAGGAVVAGASAGAMGLAAWTWTAAGGMEALGLVPGIIVAPHADSTSWARWVTRYGGSVPAGLGVIGLAERTGVIAPGDATGAWRVVGEGEARWLPAGESDPAATVVARDGESLAIGGSERLG